LRPDGPDNQIDLNFDCSASPAGFKRTDVPGMTYIRLESSAGVVARTATGYVNVPVGMNLLCLNLKGTLIARAGVQGRLVLIPPRSLTYVRGTKLILQAARGDHSSQLLSWPAVATQLLDNWVATRQNANRSQGPARNVACKPIDPLFQSAVARFDEAVAGPKEIMEPQVVSFIYEVVGRLVVGADQVQLAAVPIDLPDTIKDLVSKVRASPALAWPLKDAADMAGYSPFHFSRVFKNLVGYGFHEYVDRSRTECAVEMLCTTDNAVDVVASSCGFGTTQGLRESVKEYLGLVPSELRAIPDPIEPSE
jgi:AraC-like DNA-binding protein